MSSEIYKASFKDKDRFVQNGHLNMECTDIIIDYNGEQFIVELKLWRGNAYNERGEEQLLGYLDHYHLKERYMVSLILTRKSK